MCRDSEISVGGGGQERPKGGEEHEDEEQEALPRVTTVQSKRILEKLYYFL